MPSVQDVPAANSKPLSSVQFFEPEEASTASSRLPATKGWKVSVALPMFCTVTVCGPSVVSVEPTGVGVAKLRPGASA